MPIYLGLDSSTQSVTATAVDVDDAHPDRRAILFERTFRYDEALPGYGTRARRPALAPIRAPCMRRRSCGPRRSIG